MKLCSIDTSAWIPFFRGQDSRVVHRVEQLLADDKVDLGLDGVVLAELLQGARSGKDRNKLRHYLSELPFFKVKKEVFVRAGLINANLRRQGISIPITDAIIAATAISYRATLITTDEHFSHFPKLKYELL